MGARPKKRVTFVDSYNGKLRVFLKKKGKASIYEKKNEKVEELPKLHQTRHQRANFLVQAAKMKPTWVTQDNNNNNIKIGLNGANGRRSPNCQRQMRLFPCLQVRVNN